MTPLRPARILFVFALLFAAPLLAADKPKYQFAKPPLELLDDLAKADLGKVPAPSDDERKLLAAVWEKKAKYPTADAGLTDDQVVDLMLFASGVEDADARTKYKDKLAALRKECEKKLDGVTGTAARGEVLVQTVHDGAMKNGYEAGQSSLAGVFDTGKQNCVSSTALVFLVGTANGFDLRPMAIPGCQFAAGHAFLDLVDGKERILLETTNRDGYDAETKRKKPGVIVFGQVTDRKQAREVDGVGLAAMIYANRGVEADKKGAADHPASVRATLYALALDPLSPTAANNLLAGFDDWAKGE